MVSDREPTRDGRITAGELLDQLANDLEYQRRMADKEQFYEKRRNRYLAAAAPLIQELRIMGYAVDDVSDLHRYDWRNAIPVLLRWVPRLQDLEVKEAVVRGLTHKLARPAAAPVLIQEFRRNMETLDDIQHINLQWTIAYALSVVADDSVYDEILDLALDKHYGLFRELIIDALGRMRNSGKVDVLIQLLDDPEMVGYAATMLGKKKVLGAREHLLPLREHADPTVRKEVNKALERLDRVVEK